MADSDLGEQMMYKARDGRLGDANRAMKSLCSTNESALWDLLTPSKSHSPVSPVLAGVALALAGLLLGGCTAPIGSRFVSTRGAYAQVEANALRSGKPSANTTTVLHRYELDRLAKHQPDEAVRQLHQQALATGERDLLFALAELSYVAGERLRHKVKPWDTREARDYYLGSAVYAWLFLFGEGKDPKPGAFDRRFRESCDFYNYSLGLALTETKGTNTVARLKNSRRRLPVGEIEVCIAPVNFPSSIEEFDHILLADHFRIHGLSVRNREPGLGAPLVCVKPLDPVFGVRKSSPATVLLRGPASLAELTSGKLVLALELYSPFGEPVAATGKAAVPLEMDLTTHWAYSLNDSRIWRLGKMQFLAPAERIPSQLLLNQPHIKGRIPVVLVHGTFSSPVTWAEMANSLNADPVLRQRYQIWTFLYGSGNPLMQSVSDLRAALAARVEELDPTGTDAALRQMVVIGHSQGGLLTKSTAIDSGDRIWQAISTNRLEQLNIGKAEQAELRQVFFLEPLPFVKRVVFIATPHRGSYLATSLARRLAQRLVSLPGALVEKSSDVLKLSTGSEAGHFFHGKIPTSLDGMSPKNPVLLAMAEMPVTPRIKAHSIIPVLGDGDYRQARDGLVTYQSAHVAYAQSECIVRSKHSCLKEPSTIEEVRRILLEHLSEAHLH